MKNLAMLAGTLCLAACGGAPEPYPIRDLEESDRRFSPPSPSDAHSVTEDLLKKEELTLVDVLAIAELMNPELSAERKNIDLATAAIWEAKLYPNPVFLAEIEDYKTKNLSKFGSSKRTIGIGLPLVVGGRIGAATSVAEKAREVASVNYVWRRREILSNVKHAFTALLASRRNVELSRETRDLAKTFQEVTNERFKAQAIPEMELLKSSVQLAKSESDLRLAEKDLAVSLKALQSLMGNADFPKEKFVGELFSRFTEPSLEALRGHITTLHPLLEAAQKAKEVTDLELSLARAERIPDIGLEVRGGIDSESDAIVQLGFSIPFPVFNRNQAKVASIEIRIRQAELRIQAVRNELILRLTEAYKNFTAGQDRVAVYRDEILPKAQKALDQTNEGYRQGKFGYLDVLDAQRTLAEAKIAYAAALADLNSAAVDLEKLTGMRIEPIR
jgi:cobalt-zinc-cadmium efflux system outer membrane protein